MMYRGHVEKGVIQIEGRVALPEGAEVEVHLLTEGPSAGVTGKIPPLRQRLTDFVGQADGLPPDASVNLDHYLYGLPKRP